MPSIFKDEVEDLANCRETSNIATSSALGNVFCSDQYKLLLMFQMYLNICFLEVKQAGNPG